MGRNGARGEPWVTLTPPECTGTLVLLVDAAIDGSAPSTEALARIARTAWAIAENHLRHQDRVGLLALVGGTIVLDPRSDDEDAGSCSTHCCPSAPWPRIDGSVLGGAAVPMFPPTPMS